ncbi:hypothetical protein LTR97_012153 [Elasticomyces elasticus]|uniref:Uncharacterized protein n=1 Tax=Elasticomyces elasticus TaxID=574655 RepID=A0AAN7W0N9_9PEZI|nr:hypothetical protein LTR97_012153 [Elasticomyces elasticus]
MADSASSASPIKKTKADAAAITGCNHRIRNRIYELAFEHAPGQTTITVRNKDSGWSPARPAWLFSPATSAGRVGFGSPTKGGEGLKQDHHYQPITMRSFIIFGSAAIVAVVSVDVTGELLTFTGSASEIGTVLTTGIVAVTQATQMVFDCSPAFATTTATTSVPAPAETTPASVESSASAMTAINSETAPSTAPPASSETSPAPPAGSESSTAPPGSLTTTPGTPSAPSSSRSFVNKCRDAERTQRECEDSELSEDPITIVKHQGYGFLLGRDVYFNGGEWCLSVVPVHERISGTRNPEKARREQEREERREQESKGPLTEQQRKAFGDYVRMMDYFAEG